MNINSLLILGKLPTEIRANAQQFQDLMNHAPTETTQVKLFNKMVDIPRKQRNYLHDYTFAGVNYQGSNDLPDCVKKMLDWANTLQCGTFNQVLINWYHDGMSYIGSHSDDETQLLPGSPILSISLGATRKFRIRKILPGKSANPIVKDIDLYNNEYLIMLSPMQQYFKHEIVKVAGKKAKMIGPRINITFRQFIFPQK